MAVYHLRAEAENCLQPDTQQRTVVFLFYGQIVCLYFYDRLIIFVCECGFILVGYNRSIKVRCQYILVSIFGSF